jgi:hypothetical protein
MTQRYTTVGLACSDDFGDGGGDTATAGGGVGMGGIGVQSTGTRSSREEHWASMMERSWAAIIDAVDGL